MKLTNDGDRCVKNLKEPAADQSVKRKLSSRVGYLDRPGAISLYLRTRSLRPPKYTAPSSIQAGAWPDGLRAVYVKQPSMRHQSRVCNEM